MRFGRIRIHTGVNFQIIFLVLVCVVFTSVMAKADETKVSTYETSSHPDDIYWDTSVSTSAYGVIGSVRALTVYNGKLIAGGFFDVAGEDSVNSVASWDGTTWTPMGTGFVDPVVWALTIFDSTLIGSGGFWPYDSANNVAAWDGEEWSELGTGIVGGPDITVVEVRVLSTFDGLLIAGAAFVSGFEHNGGRVSSWDGSSWSDMGLPPDHGCYALTVFEDKLIAAGDLTAFVGFGDFLTAWDGSSWSPFVWSPFEESPMIIYALTVYDKKLIVGGWSWDGSSENSILSWDGSSWSTLGTGISGGVYALTVYQDKLIVGGSFDSAGGVPANNIAIWDGQDWSAMGSGLTGTFPWAEVHALTVYQHTIVAGGDFTFAGGKPCMNLARWTKFDCCFGDRGDVNGDGNDADILDLNFLVNRIFRSGPASDCPKEADVDQMGGSGDILDLNFLVNHIFRSGPAPGSCSFIE